MAAIPDISRENAKSAASAREVEVKFSYYGVPYIEIYELIRSTKFQKLLDEADQIELTG